MILTAPEGTPQDVMEQALENIRNRVDAFGVGEPDIALSGNTIEVQIPGSADATVRRRTADLFCLEGEDLIHGCSESEDDVRDVLESLEVQDQPSEVCVVDGEGEEIECFSSRAQADTFLAGVQVGPKPEPTPSTSATPSPSATASPSAGPSPAASAYCLTTGDRRADPVLRDAREGRGREGCARGHGHRTFVLHPPGPARAVADPVALGVRISERIAVGVRLRVAIPIPGPGHVRGSRSLRGRAAAVRTRLARGGRRGARRDRDRARGGAVLRRELGGGAAGVLGAQG